MIKAVRKNNPIMVEFSNRSNVIESGEILAYETFGEACVLVGQQRKWIPFSKLTRSSRDRLLFGKNEKQDQTWGAALAADPKSGVVVTLLLILFYLQFSM